MEKIDKKAVLEILHKVTRFNDAIIQINALPTSDRWISVSERLPETDCRTYVYDQDGDIEIMEYVSEDEYWNTAWCITHWMPFKLPTPPTK